MISTRLGFEGRIPQLSRLTAGFSQAEMAVLAQVGLGSVQARAEAGIGSDDLPMQPLSRGYARRKERLGAPPIRNLRLTGDMLSNLSVRQVSAESARIAFTTESARTKALANERRTPWLGWSSVDVQTITATAEEMQAQHINSLSVRSLLRSSPPVLSRGKGRGPVRLAA